MQPSPMIMEDDLRELRALVDEQAENARLWAHIGTPYAEHMQRALRDLHALIERATRRVDAA